MKHGFAIALSFLLMILSSNLVFADVGPCQIFPDDNPWNREIYYDPVHPQSATFIANIMATGGDNIHPDFGEDPTYGIPWDDVTTAEAGAGAALDYWPDDNEFDFGDYSDESDPGLYPIPTNSVVEGSGGTNECNGGDCHVLIINTTTCTLYELYAASYNYYGNNSWTVSSAAIFDLNSNNLRPAGWTSADAAGLPIFPGLARCDEAMSGEINHALRFTINRPYNGMYVYPARHISGSNTNPAFPAYGARMRLKANYNLSAYTDHPQALAIARAMQRYGLMLADIGSNFYVSGETNPGCWDDEDLSILKTIPGTAFEFVAYPNMGVPQTNHFTTGTPTLTWSRISWATSYQVQIDDSANLGSPIQNLTIATPDNFVALSTPLTDGRYYWRVRARKPDGTWSAYSVIETFTVDA